MSDETSDEEDSHTPPHGHQAISDEARKLANFAIALATLRDHFFTAAENFDSLPANKQRLLLLQLSEQAGDLGERAHEARRTLRDISRSIVIK